MTQLLSIPSSGSFLPLELATKYYTRWDCDIEVKSTTSGYYKCLQGYGEVEFNNGNTFKGNFSNGLMHGDGEFVWACGLKYKGPFVNNAINGVGVYEWADGSWYKGQLLKGKRHNKGEYYCSKDNSRYNGQWKNGIRHGYGLLQFNQQTSYEGQFYQGLRHGKGKMKYASGNIYQGQWVNDKKSGYGVMNWITQNQKYQGEWLNDFQHGLGTYYWFDGKIQYKIIKNIYKGYWHNGERQGFGSFFYSNGCRYEGYFQNNNKNGTGIVTDDNGNVKLECFDKDKLIWTIPQSHLGLVTVNNTYIKNTQKGSTHENRQSDTLTKISTHIKTKAGSTYSQNTARGTKLPSVQKSSFKENNPSQQVPASQTHNQSDFPPPVLQPKLKIEQNIYTKCLDMPICLEQPQSHAQKSTQKFIICKDIMNLLLRENSHLKQWYKHCSLTSGNGLTAGTNNNPHNKDFYTGVTIQNLFKLIKDLRIIDEFISIPKINREFFYQGWKTNFDITMPKQKKLTMIKEYLEKQKPSTTGNSEHFWQTVFNNEKVNYSNIEWYNYAKQIEQQVFSNSQLSSESQIDLNLFNDIQNPKKIILFRHFVCYLLRIAYLQTLKHHISKPSNQDSFQKSFRQTLQKLFKTISSIYEISQRDAKGVQSMDNLTFVSKERAAMNLSIDYSKPNEELFAQITKNYNNLNNFADNTVTVKVLYQLLEKFGYLKEPAEKLLFLEKIERILEPCSSKHSLLRKQLKAQFPAIQKVIYTSPYFQRILSYTMIQRQFEQMLYIAVNRKINSNCKQDAIKKYKQAIEQITNFVKKQSSSVSNPEQPQQKLQMRKPITQKDKQKIQLIKENEERKAAERQAERKRLELKREEIERAQMERNDFRWEEDQMQESQEYFD